MKVYKWPEDRYIESEFSDFAVNPTYGARQWKAIFDHPHRFGLGSVTFRDALPTEPNEVTGKEEDAVVGLLFEHKLMLIRVLIFCSLFLVMGILTTVLIGKVSGQGYHIGIAAGAFVVAIGSLILAAITLITKSS